MSVNKQGIILFIMSVFIFVFSVAISLLYTSGDQIHYVRAYDGVNGLGIRDAFLFYNSALSSKELIHFFYIYFGSNVGIDKVILMSLSNTLFFYLVMKVCKLIGIPFLYAFIIVITNFYFVVLLFGAERLKFGFIFLCLSYIAACKGNKISSYGYAIISVLSHAQMSILYLALLFEPVFKSVSHSVSKLKISPSKLIFLLLSVVPIFLIFPQIASKVPSYINYTSFSLIDFAKWLAFFSITLLSSQNHRAVMFFYIAIFFPIMLLGAERVLLYCLLFFYIQYSQKTKFLNIFSFLLIMYFGLKTIIFFYKVALTGDGFGLIGELGLL